RWDGRAAGDAQWGRELLPLLHAGRAAADLRFEPGRPAGPGVRPLPGERGRHGAGAGDHGTAVRRLPDVLAGWQAPGVGVEPQREGAGGDEYLHRGLGRIAI